DTDLFQRGNEDAGENSTVRVEGIIMTLMEAFQSEEVEEPGLSPDEVGPYQNVLLQELGRLQTLLAAAERELVELQKGLEGKLTMTDPMEALQVVTNQCVD
ncbi:unnamed protein product, partial [Heterosigma akashiwo]